MIVQCSNCGAPLDVVGSESHVQCKYCGLSNQVRKMKTLHAITPAGWMPPPTWVPPQQPMVHYPPVYPQQVRVVPAAAAAGTSMTGCAIAGFTTLVIAAASLIPLWQSGALSGLPGMNAWDGTEPFRCGGNDSVRIEGVVANLPRDTAITVEANCELEIVDSNITAWQGIDAGGNRRVLIRNSTIRAAGTGIRADGNKVIELVNSTVIASGGPGVEAGGIARVIVSGGRVEGTPLAVTTDALASQDVRAGGQLINSPAPVPGMLPLEPAVGDKN